MEQLAGTVVFLAVPAEEYVDLTWRRHLRDQGEIEFIGGKAELIRLGVFDDVDMAMMSHVTGKMPAPGFRMRLGNAGFVAKAATFQGRAAHAGRAPHTGRNALSAAVLAIQALHAIRELFDPEDLIRINPIVTQGGTAVNVVPDHASVETLVRGLTVEAVDVAAAHVDRGLQAGAQALGVRVQIDTTPGYLPRLTFPMLDDLFLSNAAALVGETACERTGYAASSTDAGDLSHLMPVLHPNHGGCSGDGHTTEFRISDPHAAYILPAQAMACTLVDLLEDGGHRAEECVAAYKPRLTKADYLNRQRAIWATKSVSYE
jgi:amidohydrolase